MMLSPLLLTAIWSYLPTSTHHAYVCSAGSKGYHALKEMLQNGMPGNTLLLESGDLREVDSSNLVSSCCLVYVSPVFSHQYAVPYHPRPYADQIPPTITHITIYSNHSCLPQELLKDCCTLHSLDLSPMTLIVEMGDMFLSECTALKEVNLSPLSQLTETSESFLYDCCGLTALDLSPLSNVTVIEEGFLHGCSGLLSLDLSPLSNVEDVGGLFLSDCSGLTTIDLTPLSRLTEIYHSFLGGCSGLVSIDLSPLSRITRVGGSFVRHCTSLTTLDLTPLSKLVAVEEGFLLGCSGLKSIDLSPLSNVKKINHAFLSECTGLTALDMSPLRQLERIISNRHPDRSLLGRCTAVTIVVAPPLCDPPTGWVVVTSDNNTNQWKRHVAAASKWSYCMVM